MYIRLIINIVNIKDLSTHFSPIKPSFTAGGGGGDPIMQNRFYHAVKERVHASLVWSTNFLSDFERSLI
jgi:hypothetical protein